MKYVTCGKFMPLAKEQCARWAEHRDGCRTRASLTDARSNRTRRAMGMSVASDVSLPSSAAVREERTAAELGGEARAA